jgi:hypothetical protein
MSDLAYIFFEPRNQEFFKTVAEYYCNRYVEAMKKVAEKLESSFGSYPDHKLIDKECNNFDDEFSFPPREIVEESCVKNKKLLANTKVVITSRQNKQLMEAIGNAISKFEENHEVRNTWINKIKVGAYWSKKIEVFKLDDDLATEKFKEYYVKAINGRESSKTNAKFFFFVSAKTNSDYNLIKTETKLKPFRKCTAVQNIIVH